MGGLDTLMAGWCITDPMQEDTPLLFVNPGVETMTGFPAGELVGENLAMVLSVRGWITTGAHHSVNLSGQFVCVWTMQFSCWTQRRRHSQQDLQRLAGAGRL